MAERQLNPIFPRNEQDNHFPDPHIKIFVNPDTGRENMYMYVGRDFGENGFDLRDWYVLYSEDLVEWTCKKVLDRQDTYLPPDSTECWACDVVRSPWDGRYYLYYSHCGHSTGVAVSDRPDGPFRDANHLQPILPPGITPTNSYDPDVILPDDQDDRAWIVFGSDWTDHYWAMQLDESMTKVVPGTARKVPVWPDADRPEELKGELRSDQAEAFRYGDMWYLYWAGRYATSKNRLGPYVFRGNIGADIPHYPDGRAFIDHGSFVEWRGQWFYAVCQGIPHWWKRKSNLMYLHVCDDGTLMFDETIRRCGVGCYCGGWERIEAEWYMEKEAELKKIQLHRDGQHAGFGVKNPGGSHALSFPHVYDLQGAESITFCLQARENGAVEVLSEGVSMARAEVSHGEEYQCVTAPFHPGAREMHITLILQGEMTLDWFRFNQAE